MGQSWWSAELATAVTGSQAARFPCVELHEKTWSMNTRQAQEVNYFIEFLMLQDAFMCCSSL